MTWSIAASGARLARCLGLAGVCAFLFAFNSAPSSAAAPLTLGIDSYGPLGSPDPSIGLPWVARAADDGASLVRIVVVWADVAPSTLPNGFRQSDPGSPFYHWPDSIFRQLAAKRISPVLQVWVAPSWAEGANRPSGLLRGTWRPDARALGNFAKAAALRYSGHYPDPALPGRYLPRVRYWQAWNEPNLTLFLAPQWVRSGGRWIAESPILYRGMLNAFYAGVKSVSRKNVVVTGGTAPFGDPFPGRLRIPPVRFVRDLLCLRGRHLNSTRCKHRAHFDVLDHHPFDPGGPSRHAVNGGDVSVPDMGKLTRLLRAARRARTVLPRSRKRVWSTELFWASRPPDPRGIPFMLEARWIEQAFYYLWREGVDTVLWEQIVDDSGQAGGLYFQNAQPKPALTAYRFPFVAVHRGSRHIRVWGRAPSSGTLLIQRQRGHRWITQHRLRVRRFTTFFVSLSATGSSTWRGRIRGLTSLTWSLR
jgi:hypothetical protein